MGSTTEITNPSGDVVQRYVYDSFGNTSIYNKDGTAITESSTDYLKNPYIFTGRERDPETGLHYHRARYYNPEAGRWISSDPIEFESGDTNFYRYVGNNSINLVDPNGLLSLDPIDIYNCITGEGDQAVVAVFLTNINRNEKEIAHLLDLLNEKDNNLKEPLCDANPEPNQEDKENIRSRIRTLTRVDEALKEELRKLRNKCRLIEK